MDIIVPPKETEDPGEHASSGTYEEMNRNRSGSWCHHNTGDITEDSSVLLDTREFPGKALPVMSLGNATAYLLTTSTQTDQVLQ